MNEALFSLPSDSIAVTSDDCYTPRWIFDRWLSHDTGVLMGIVLPQVRWTKRVFMGAEALAFTGVGTGGGQDGFIRPDGTSMRPRNPVFVAFRGVGVEPAMRLAAADPYGAVLFGGVA